LGFFFLKNHVFRHFIVEGSLAKKTVLNYNRATKKFMHFGVIYIPIFCKGERREQ